MLHARTSAVRHVAQQETVPAGGSNSSSGKAAGESKPEAYHRGYVEDFDEPRTKQADCFSILLCHEFLQKGIAFIPFTMPAVGIDVPRLADIDEYAPPCNRAMFSMGQRSERVIRAGDHVAPKSKRLHRHRCKPMRHNRETCALRIRHRYEKGALRNQR
jgi:hypothetical protein